MIVRAVAALAVALLAASATPGWAAAASASRVQEADSLHAAAVRLLARDEIDPRRSAIALLERATLLDPDVAEYQLTLARAYYRSGFVKLARERFELVTRMAPADARGRFGLGQVWRRDWLKYLDATSLTRAVIHLSSACRLDPTYTEAWLLMTPLLIEQGNIAAAVAAADQARALDPRNAEAILAAAYTHFRRGDVRFADGAFASAIPRMPPHLRARFDDIAPVASEADTMILHRLPLMEQAAFVERFWRENDPDLTTPVNEAKLEYWSRVAHAYFLFFNERRGEWDVRGEIYVRYGAPRWTNYNPYGKPLYFGFATGPPYPANSLVWTYPELGMEVLLQDRLLNEHYLFPIDQYNEMDPIPHPDSLIGREDRLAVRGGRGVFPTLPPGKHPLPTHAVVARFTGGHGPRLLAQVEAPGGPADSLWAEWVVADTAYNVIARGRRPLSPSACDALERRVADFAGDVPPGDYTVSVSVEDGHGGRGVHRRRIHVPFGLGFHVSDLVVSCGPPFVSPGVEATVRVEPNPQLRVGPGEPLTAYFEVYGLRLNEEGQSRFEYEYTVVSAERDPRIWLQRIVSPRRDPPPISASREETQAGSLRRQFVSVPVQPLPMGRYRLEVRVRDLVGGGEVITRADFSRVGPPGS